MGQPQIIAVEHAHILARGERNACVPRRRRTLIPLPVESYAVIDQVRPYTRSGVVRRTVVNDNDLEVLTRLREHGIERGANRCRSVICRNDDAERRRLLRGGIDVHETVRQA
jgi:hypothetical protein